MMPFQGESFRGEEKDSVQEDSSDDFSAQSSTSTDKESTCSQISSKSTHLSFDDEKISSEIHKSGFKRKSDKLEIVVANYFKKRVQMLDKGDPGGWHSFFGGLIPDILHLQQKERLELKREIITAILKYT